MTGERTRGTQASSPPWRVWAGILVPPLAWVVQFNLAYFVVTAECQAGVLAFNWVLLAVSLVPLVLVLLTGALSWSTWRANTPEDQGGLGDAMGRSGAMALLGVALSAVFAFAILLTLLTQTVVPAC